VQFWTFFKPQEKRLINFFQKSITEEGKENIRIKVDGKEFIISRWFYSDIINMFYDKEIQGLITEGDKLIIKTKIQDFQVYDNIFEQGFKMIYEASKRDESIRTVL